MTFADWLNPCGKRTFAEKIDALAAIGSNGTNCWLTYLGGLRRAKVDQLLADPGQDSAGLTGTADPLSNADGFKAAVRDGRGRLA
jgi:hypothetical protein